MVERPRLKKVAHNEGIAGHRAFLQASLIKSGYISENVDVTYPGADVVWSTLHKPPKIAGAQIKTTWDFVNSWFSGSLQRQLIDLTHSVDIPILLLEGTPMLHTETGGIMVQTGIITRGKNKAVVPFSTYSHILASLTGYSPIKFFLVISPTPKYTLQWLTGPGWEYFDDAKHALSWSRQEQSVYRPTSLGLRLISALAEVGPGRALSLMKRYGTARRILSLILTGDLQAPGIGAGILQAIDTQLDEES